MFLGSVIAEKRKIKGLNQTELAEGICTQNTISKIEKHNVAPSVPILFNICKRLDITFNDAFSDFSTDTASDETVLLNSIEADLIIDGHSSHEDMISAFNENTLSQFHQQKLYIIEALLNFNRKLYEDASFFIDKVIVNSHGDMYDIHALLAFTLKGLINKEQGSPEREAYFMKIVEDAIQENLEIAKSETVELSFLCKHLASFYVSQENDSKVKDYCQRGLKLNQQRRSVYFVADFYSMLGDMCIKKTETKELADSYKVIANSLSSFISETFD
ncbi:helix-turn-helix domain-containing protein [Lactiplantibacillus plantarum]|uniref:helix-turn-helix domain-containing protein n=1 Tax=Lactiplantibacillus plantarum TaxID=1590 RepID=UPI001AAF0A1D|nr:helix-turn-helix transcriptional regulator [Lactiplantibacillus plantarum]MBO2705789.1 helix-turn-helix domain-containing protein [Lactiplantibacillus plantarum]MDN7038277.1 helix-turn-helix transcriptional regulator [Lactiplantibacillus plantarum]MDO7795367.1 helix-turn-helix transcriptional regulator [Lactiplantibacillus plantarum]WVI00472.1 helix-turn-helix transcriptional regulator [Lactiplantibacillus plantarum]